MNALLAGPSSRRAGFTLLEVLVSLAIFALAAIVLATAYTNVLGSYQTISRYADSAPDLRFVRSFLLAESERELAERGDEVILPGDRRAVWRAEIEPTEVADLFTVRFICEIHDLQATEPEVTTQIFHLLRPTWSTTEERQRLRGLSRERIEGQRSRYPL